MINRRRFLQTATATAALAAQGFSGQALAQQGLKMAAPAPFSFEELKRRAQTMSRMPYVAPPSPSPEILQQIDYDAHGKIRFKTDLALWANGPSEFPVTFFHLGRFFQKPVRMHVVEGGQAREIVYDPDYFDMPANSPAHGLPANSGFAGFRFQEARNGKLDWKKNDWVAFLGASYFRAIGELFQYGLSARGLAVDVAVFGKNEEFPDFTHVYFETPQAGSDTVTIYALLDGPSVAGAYRFVMQRAAAIVMDIDSNVFMRQDVEPPRHRAPDLDVLVFGKGEGHRRRLAPRDPRFGRAGAVDRQRRAHLAPAQQPAAHHHLGLHRREPEAASACSSATGTSTITSTASITTAAPRSGSSRRATWGQGSIQLVEIPTDDEIHDNIVAMWVSGGCRARPGRRWNSVIACTGRRRSPIPTPLARFVATRLGNGGQAGTSRPKGVRKFMIEFLGRAPDQAAERA